VSVHAAPVTAETVVVAVDAGKNGFALLLSDDRRRRLLGPVEAAMTAPAVRELAAVIERRVPAGARVRVVVEAAGHYHRPLLAPGV
jgi:transposase